MHLIGYVVVLVLFCSGRVCVSHNTNGREGAPVATAIFIAIVIATDLLGDL